MAKHLFGKFAVIFTSKKPEIVDIDQFGARNIFEDTGWLRDYKVFDVMEVKENIVFHLSDHLKRLTRSADLNYLPTIGILGDFGRMARQAIEKVLEANKFKSSLVWVYITGGKTDDGFRQISRPNIYILVSLFSRPKLKKGAGLRLKTIDFVREFPEIKNTNYFTAEKLQTQLTVDGFNDVLYCRGMESALETSRANFFIVSENGIIKTPSDNILFGVTRSIVLYLANNNNFSVKEQIIKPEDVREAKEAFITSTTKGVWPIIKINEKLFEVGPATLKLRELFEKYRREYYKNVES